MFFHTIPQKKKNKKEKKKAFGHSIPCCPWRRTDSIWYFSWKAGWQILSNGVVTSSLLSEHTPSQKYALRGKQHKGSSRRQQMPTSLPFPFTPSGLRMAQEFGESTPQSCVQPLWAWKWPLSPLLPSWSVFQTIVGGLVAKSCLTPGNPMGCSPPGSSIHGISQARILEWVDIFSGIFPTQGLNLHLLHCRQILHRLSYQGSPS